MSLDNEASWRLSNLCNESHIWLIQVATNITKHSQNAEDAVGDLYLYLANKPNRKVFWGKSYNLIYCMRIIKTRFLNKAIKGNRIRFKGDMIAYDTPDVEYDIDKDIQLMETWERVQSELTRLKSTKQFAPATIFEMYMMTDDKMMDVAKKIGISKSTTFSCIKKIKKHMQTQIPNPCPNE